MVKVSPNAHFSFAGGPRHNSPSVWFMGLWTRVSRAGHAIAPYQETADDSQLVVDSIQVAIECSGDGSTPALSADVALTLPSTISKSKRPTARKSWTPRRSLGCSQADEDHASLRPGAMCSMCSSVRKLWARSRVTSLTALMKRILPFRCFRLAVWQMTMHASMGEL